MSATAPAGRGSVHAWALHCTPRDALPGTDTVLFRHLLAEQLAASYHTVACSCLLHCCCSCLPHCCYPLPAEYLADMVGYTLVDNAVGSALTNKSMSYHDVGDFYPSNLISNKRGAQNVTLPTLADQITM